MIVTAKLVLIMVACTSSSSASGLWNFKQNCGVSLWSRWITTQDHSTRTRTREVYRFPKNGGAECPELSQTQKLTLENPLDPNLPAAELAPILEVNLLSPRYTTDGTHGRRRRQTTSSTILPRDILFILDTSGSITRSGFETAKINIADLIGEICGDVGPGTRQNRVAVLTFSSKAKIEFVFSDNMNLGDVQTAIKRIPFRSGNTCLEEALKLGKEVFQKDKGMRDSGQSVKEVVILTDGGWNCESPPKTYDEKIYRLATELSTSRGMDDTTAIYALVIGGKIPTADLKKFERLVNNIESNHVLVFWDLKIFKETVQIIKNRPYRDLCVPIIQA